MKPVIERILIPTDLTEYSGKTLETGIRLARKHNASVILQYIACRDGESLPEDKMFIEIDQIPEYPSLPESQVLEFASELSRINEIPVSAVISSGDPVRSVINSSKDIDADLIVFDGTCRRVKRSRTAFVTDTLKIIRTTQCPVLVLPGQSYSMNFRKAIFPVRFPEGFENKYKYARLILADIDTELLLLGFTDMKDRGQTRLMTDFINGFKNKLKSSGIKCQTAYVITDDTQSELLRVAEENEADILVITADLDSGTLNHSVATFVKYIIRESPMPVLAIRQIL